MFLCLLLLQTNNIINIKHRSTFCKHFSISNFITDLLTIRNLTGSPFLDIWKSKLWRKKISWNIDDIDNIKDRIETSVFPQGILLTIFFTPEKRNIYRNIDLLKRLMNNGVALTLLKQHYTHFHVFVDFELFYDIK